MRQRPTSVLVIAIFHFIFGGLGLMCNLAGIAEMLAGGSGVWFQSDPRQAQMQRDMEKTLEQAAPSVQLVTIADTVVSLCFACVLLVAGYGLVKMVPWGRSLSLVYGYAALIEKVALGLYTILVTLPLMGTIMQPMLAQAKNAQERQMFEIFIGVAKVGAFVGLLIPVIYPFVVLLAMNTATVKNAFRNAAAGPLGDDRERALDEGFPSGGPFRSGPDDRFKA